MMLHHRRKRLEELAKLEAEGQSFWTEKFEMTVRTKIVHALDDFSGSSEIEVASLARGLILRDEGLPFLVNPRQSEWYDFVNYIGDEEVCSNEMVPSVIEAIYVALDNVHAGAWESVAERFATVISEILREHRISFDLINGQMVEFSSRELHVSVVAPTLSLLSRKNEFGRVETAYQNALGEISDGKASNAITDAGVALQEMFSALGCKGSSLGPLIKSAMSKGLIVGHDERMVGAIRDMMDWVSADRSTTGDAHQASEAAIDDAWLTVHVVGALLLRLAGASRRGKPS
jgi:hypothetical protein